jgi:hypothetical protein
MAKPDLELCEDFRHGTDWLDADETLVEALRFERKAERIKT